MPILRPITLDEYATWLAATIPAYAAEKVASGQWPEATAIEQSTQEYADLLPLGPATPENHLFTIIDADADADAAAVGVLWFAVKTRFNARIAYVFDVSIRPERQRQGHALRAFQALDGAVRKLGLAGIALHVFGHNMAARALYDKLGFEATSINLYKRVDAAPGDSEAAAA
jgi:ribosomal protein S18 acetylase RimI-like enzyme